jgi:K+-transporting ATPase KdpF subunit
MPAGLEFLVLGGELPGRLGTATSPRSVESHSERRRVRPADTRDLRPVGPGCEGGRAAVSADNVIGLVVAVLLVGYLILALVFPERF